MAWYICFFLAYAVAAVGIFLAVRSLVLKYKTGRISPFYIVFAACFLCGVILSVAPYVEACSKEVAAGWKVSILSVVNSIMAFGAESLYAIILETVGAAPRWMQTPYIALSLIVQVLAPILTFGFLLSFFKNLSAWLKYFFARKCDIYAFSRLTEKSLALATDILKNHKNAKIVFADVFDDADDAVAQLIDDARELGAICFKKSISLIDFKVNRSKKASINFFAIGENEMENLEHALKLSERYSSCDNINLYVFSVGVEGELLLAGVKNSKMKIRRVDEAHSLITRLLYDEGNIIFDTAKESEDGTYKQISAVIVGMGWHGTELLRSLAWYGQMNGYRLKLTAFEKDKLAKEKFTAKCPELISDKYNGVYVEGEAYYDIEIHPDTDVMTKSFADKISQITDATYVFISLGSDELNIKTAVAVRMYFERIGIKPFIHAVVRNAETAKLLSGVTNYAHQPYKISFTGDLQTRYSERVVLGSEIEDDAFERHKAYCKGDTEKENEFWKYEYCYRSSVASTVHASARIKCGISGADKAEAELTVEERDTIEVLEHKRWNAYMRSEGYIYSGSPDKSSRNDLARMHHNLVEFERLDPETKRTDSRVGSKK